MLNERENFSLVLIFECSIVAFVFIFIYMVYRSFALYFCNCSNAIFSFPFRFLLAGFHIFFYRQNAMLTRMLWLIDMLHRK